MAIENTYLLGKNITLGCGFDLQAKAPLDSRQTVPSTAGLQALIDGNAAYEGMIVYDEESKKTYQAQLVDDVLAFREFGINEAELKDLIASETTAAMEFKGAAAALPENPAKGDMYKVTASFKVGEEDVKVGDSIVYDGEQWFIIPSGDDIEDTWRPVDGVDNDSTLKFVAGDKLEKTVAADGTITYKHAAIDAPENMNAEGDEQTRTYITQLITDNHGHIIGFKTATENVEDTNTTYVFEGQSDDPTDVYFLVTSSDVGAADAIYLNAYSKNEADGKFVAKETGKSLISDDEIARLAKVDNYDDEEVRGLIGDNAQAIEDLETYVGTIPNVADEEGNNKYADLDVIGYINKKAQETLAAASGNSSETAASVKQQLDDYIGENNTRVESIEGDIADINNADTGILKKAQDYADSLAGNYDESGAAAGVKSELEVEIAKKVDKVDGKSLIDDSEIARLATLANYDDTQVKADIAKKADAEAMTTELGKKVDKVDGKDLIATSEIERLATLKNYDDTQVKADIAKKADADTMTTELGKKVDKVDGYSLVSDVEIARLADVDNYDDTVLVGRVTTAEGKIADLETESAKHALKADVEAEFAKYTKTSDLPTDLGDFTNNAGYAKTADVNAELEKKADKSVVDAMYTNGQIDTAVQGAKDYAKGLVDAIPAQTDYTVTITETTDGLANDIAKKYTFTQNGAEIGTINLAKELVVTSGSVKEVAEAGKPYEGAVVGDKYIELVIANQDAPIYVPAKDLVDIYTAKDMTGVEGAEIQVAISNTNEISATLVNGGITEEKLAEGVKTKLNKTWEEVGVAAGLVENLTNGQVKANKEAIEKLNGADTVDGSVAKSIKDAIAGENLGQYAKTADLGDLAALDTITADKVSDFATEVAKVKVDEAVKADEATKAAQDGNGKVIADTYAEKATTLAGYGIGDAYTKTEIEALLTWGEF